METNRYDPDETQEAPAIVICDEDDAIADGVVMTVPDLTHYEYELQQLLADVVMHPSDLETVTRLTLSVLSQGFASWGTQTPKAAMHRVYTSWFREAA